MKIKFADDTEFKCIQRTEQMTFANGAPAGWVINAVVQDASSALVQSVLTGENISEISAVTDNGGLIATITGYEKINALAVKYIDDSPIATFQLSKGV